MKVTYPETEWKPFTTLPNSDDDTMGPSSSHLYVWHKKGNYITHYMNWNNWSTKDYVKEAIKNGDLWTYAVTPLNPNEWQGVDLCREC